MSSPPIRLRSDAVVVLAGPSGSGKSTWAAEWFRPSQVVSSDELRGIVGEHEHDLRASTDAFALLDEIVRRRVERGLLTVIDTLGMDTARHQHWIELAAAHDRPIHLVVFDETPATCRKRNRSRAEPVPSKVLTSQLTAWAELAPTLGPGFTAQHVPGPAAVVAQRLLSDADSHRGDDQPHSMRFGLSISTFDIADGATIAHRLGQVAAEAEHAGFDTIWVMDHFMQIPQVGREWDPMLEAYSTLSWLAARTSRVRIGALVTCITHRNIAHLGKLVATLDVLSEGRAICGLGAGWFEREHHVHGYRFPPLNERYELLEDALEFLPLQWGPGTPAFGGRRFATPEARCYPRPIQARVPILVGGSGEQRTLRLAAQYADACNLFGDPEVVAHKVDVLTKHCHDVGRDPADVEVTHLSPILSATDIDALHQRLDLLRPSSMSREVATERLTAGTVDDHIGRFRRLADAGVQHAIVSLADVGHDGSVGDFAPVIDAFRP